MGKDVIIRGETYNGVGKVNLLTANGSANFYDVSGALCTITAEYDEVEEYDEVYTSDKTAQEVYDALDVGINPVFRFHNLLDTDTYIYASLTKLESTENGEELSLSSFQTDAMIADTLSDYFTLTVQGEPPAVEKTVTGAVVTVTDALAEPAVDLVTTIVPVQSGTGTPSPTNVRSISGWTGANIYVCDINLWDGTWENGNISDSTGENSGTSASYFRCVGYIPFKGGKSYYPYSSSRSGNYRQYYYDKDKNFLGYTGLAWNTVKDTSSLEYADKICFMRFRVYGTHADGDNTISFNIPSTETTAQTYGGATYAVSFGSAGTVYGGSIDVTTGVLTIDHQMFLFDSSDTGNWTVNANNYFQRLRPTGFSETSSDAWPKKFYSNALETTTRSGSAGNIQFNSFYAGSTYLAVRIDSFNHDLTTFQNFLTNTGLQILVPIAEQTVQLTPTEVTLLLGTNNVWSDAGDTTLTYLADGRVNSLTALNMLLGGMYEPSSDVTDREALQIIMGETE